MDRVQKVLKRAHLHEKCIKKLINVIKKGTFCLRMRKVASDIRMLN